MPITILQPRLPPQLLRRDAGGDSDSDSDSEDSTGGGVDLEGDVSMNMGRPSKRTKYSDDIVTPGEVITDDAQFMRGHGTYTTTSPATSTSAIASSLAGLVTRTNRLLSVRPLRARYAPEVGDLVVGRVAEVQPRRWRVAVGAAQLAALPLSAVNLPGGVQRRRTETDELAIRSFFAEGDLLVAEVQQVHADGGAVLHTRSLRYGKLRNGVFVAVGGTGGAAGGGAGVVRSRRQVWTMDVAGARQHGGGAKVDVVLGVNGYVWISKHVEDQSLAGAAGGASVSVTNMEDSVSQAVYSSQNDVMEIEVMREITRVRGVITALVENGLRVDEDMVMRGYSEAVDMARASDEGEEDTYLGGERGQHLAAMLVAK